LVVRLGELPASFQVFVSCRPESEVLEALLPRLAADTIKDLDDLDEQTKHSDVLTFITSKLAAIPADASPMWPPPPHRIEEFALRCGGLMILAEVRIRLVEEGRRSTLVLNVFDDILTSTEGRKVTIEAEYDRIMRRGFIDGIEDSQIKQHAYKRYRKLVGAFITMRWNSRPLDLLSDLFGMDVKESEATLKPLSAVLYAVAGENVHSYHATFKEYLLGSDDSPSHFPIRFDGEQHDLVASACFSYLNRADLSMSEIMGFLREWRDDPMGASDFRHFIVASWAVHLADSVSPYLQAEFEKFMKRHEKSGFWSAYPEAWVSAGMRKLHDWYKVSWHPNKWLDADCCL
jgi:hypothetical protein